MKILVTDPISSTFFELIRKDGFDVVYKPYIERKELLVEIRDKDALVVRGRTKVDREVIDHAEKIKLIVRTGVGLDNIDLEYARTKGIAVFNTPGATSNAVAELTVCLILSLLRRAYLGHEALRRGEWIKNKLIGFELKGKTVGILGFGRIGYEVAKKLKAFDCRIIAHSRTDKSKLANEIGIEFSTDLDYLLSNSDILTVHLSLNPSTYLFLNKERLAKLKKGSFIVNTSRGAIIDEKALLELIESGHIAGVALDVFEKEPPDTEVEKKLISMDNVIVTPHIGAQTREAMEEEAKEAAMIISEFFRKLKY